MGCEVGLNVLEELASGEGVLAAGAGMHNQGMPLSAVSLHHNMPLHLSLWHMRCVPEFQVY